MRYTHYTKDERNELSILLNKGYSQKDCAEALGRSPSSVSREVKHGSLKGRYDPVYAHTQAKRKRRDSKYQSMKIREHAWLERYVQNALTAGWTPEEIDGRLRDENGGTAVISFKAVYQYLDTVWGEPYRKHLPYAKRRKPKGSGKRGKAGARRDSIRNRVFIEHRPPSAAARNRIGDFEADTLGAPKRASVTVAGAVDRTSLYFMGRKVRLKKTIEGYKELFQNETVHTLTIDNGVEHARYRELGVPTYFCHPYRSWEKPYIENTFQRLRRFIPKGVNIAAYTDEQVAGIIRAMNHTPRKSLGYRTPSEVYYGYYKPTINQYRCCT